MRIVNGAFSDSSSGLLRSVPVIAKGINPRKVIVVISGNDDKNLSASASSATGPLAMTQMLHKEKHICSNIIDGLKHYPKGTLTKASDIYYFSIGDDTSAQQRSQFWSDYCVGQNHAMFVSDYEKLMAGLNKITQSSSVHFINNTEKL
ncbi:hypothetical protein D3C75_831990 [compost metagenome]